MLITRSVGFGALKLGGLAKRRLCGYLTLAVKLNRSGSDDTDKGVLFDGLRFKFVKRWYVYSLNLALF
jgi:hypothetical protein